MILPVAPSCVKGVADFATAAMPSSLPPADWFDIQAEWYDRAEGLAAAPLVAAALRRLAATARGVKAATAAEMHALRGTWLAGFDSTLVAALPDRWNHSELAEQLAAAAHDLAFEGTDAAALAGWALADLAWDAEHFHSATVKEYLDSEAAWHATRDEVPDESMEWEAASCW